MRDGRQDSEIPFTEVSLAGVGDAFGVTYCKRDASARYSALQDPHPASPKLIFRFWVGNRSSPIEFGGGDMAEGVKAGGTTRRPLVLQMDRGRILFCMEVQHVRPEPDPRKA